MIQLGDGEGVKTTYNSHTLLISPSLDCFVNENYPYSLILCKIYSKASVLLWVTAHSKEKTEEIFYRQIGRSIPQSF